MFGGASRRVVSLWFPRLPSDRALRTRPVDGPFALTARHENTDRIYCITPLAEKMGVYRGMALSDARALCSNLQTRPAELRADQRFLDGLRRWATRYCPWIGIEGTDGLIMDITGAAHLAGGEAALMADLYRRLTQARLHLRIGLADTRGAAWALAHYGNGKVAQAKPAQALKALGQLSVAALRLDADMVTALQRLGLRQIAQLADSPRAPLARRFGPTLLMRLDQALGTHPEQISPQADPPHYGVRITLPDPIGLEADVMAATAKLLERLCDKLAQNGTGARLLRLSLRRVDQQAQHIELRLARPMRDAARILPLFARSVGDADAGFGIDQLRLEAIQTEPLPSQQISHDQTARSERLDDLITRIGVRIGLDNIQRFLPAQSHIPERSFLIAPAAYSLAKPFATPTQARPLILFPPEPVAASGHVPPPRFRWRRMQMGTLHVTGPERIAPEWWLEDGNWHNGLRDYWIVQTRQGRRLWMFHTPQSPGWFIQGEFA